MGEKRKRITTPRITTPVIYVSTRQGPDTKRRDNTEVTSGQDSDSPGVTHLRPDLNPRKHFWTEITDVSDPVGVRMCEEEETGVSSLSKLRSLPQTTKLVQFHSLWTISPQCVSILFSQ